jgi:hypothetical protein
VPPVINTLAISPLLPGPRRAIVVIIILGVV